jgi:hypothetical protein
MTNNLLLQLEDDTTFLSARDLARAAGATKPQVIYWAKAGYLESRKGGYFMFPLSQLRKAKVMAVLIERVGLDAEKASHVSSKLLARFSDAPDEAKAVLIFLDALYDRIDDVIDLMGKTKFAGMLLDSFENEAGDSEGVTGGEK